MKIGIDLGGSHIAIGVVDGDGKIVKKVETKNKQAHKTIEKSMMDGFLLEGKVFKKESVSVYLYRPSAVDKAEIRNEEGGN